MRCPAAIAALCTVFLTVALAPLTGVSGAPPGPGPAVSVSGLRVSSALPVDGDNLTVSVTIANNGTEPLTAREVAFFLTAGRTSPVPFRRLDNITLPAGENTTVTTWWVAYRGTYTLSVSVSLAQGNSTIPLPPATLRVTVSGRLIQEAGKVSLYVGGVLLFLLAALVVMPTVLEASATGRRRRAAPPPPPPPAGPPPASSPPPSP